MKSPMTAVAAGAVLGVGTPMEPNTFVIEALVPFTAARTLEIAAAAFYPAL